MFRGRDLDVIVEEKPDIKVEVKENFEDEVQVIQPILTPPESSLLKTPEKKPMKKRPVLSPASSAWLNIQKKLRSPTFSATVHKKAVSHFEAPIDPKAKDRETRSKMHAREDCACCRPYFDALGLSKEETSKRIQAVGKHRAVYHYERTPPRYWDLEMTPEKSQSPQKPVVKKRRK